jgi:hypothetical protein
MWSPAGPSPCKQTHRRVQSHNLGRESCSKVCEIAGAHRTMHFDVHAQPDLMHVSRHAKSGSRALCTARDFRQPRCFSIQTQRLMIDNALSLGHASDSLLYLELISNR